MNKRNLNLKTLTLSTLLCSAIGSSGVQADDVEVYMAPAAPVSPNVLFVLDESGSMRWGAIDGQNLADTNPNQRMNQLQTAIETVLDNSDNDYINAGFLAYTTRTHPTRVVHQFGRIGTDRASMKIAVGDPDVAGDGLTPISGTPSVHALASAVLWYDQGFRGQASPIASDPEENWCRPNYIVFMSDGSPNTNSYYIDLAGTYTDPGWKQYRGTTCANDPGPPTQPYDTWDTSGGRCAGEITRWAFNTDLRTGAGWDNTQNITTHTVAMGRAALNGTGEQTFMQYVAATGNGQYFPASNAAALTNAFQQILTQAGASIPYTYMAPTVPFNSSSAAVSGDAIYVPLFAPDGHSMWYGNVKRYKLTYELSATPTALDPAPPMKVVIRDKNNNLVVNDSDMSFETNTLDLWNPGSTADNGEPLVGGAASNMNGTRKLYTWLPGNSTDLTDSANLVDKSNALLNTTAVMGDLMSNTDLDDLPAGYGATFADRKNTLLDWLNWVDITNLPDGNSGTITVSHSDEMGAPLHTNPIAVDPCMHDNTCQDTHVFVATVEGILHALDIDTGEELWAFMPEQMLETIADSFVSDWDATKPHTPEGEPIPTNDHGHVTKPGNYGLDGPTVVYETDNNHRYLVQGMRRGGRNYYALDITDLDNPVMAWTIEGGTGDFTAMGQTWSKPIFAKMEIQGATAKEVLIFGGGYDDDQDDSYVDNNHDGVFNGGDTPIGRVDDDLGNIIYIVDARTGVKLKTISTSTNNPDVTISDMRNGIASDILTIDINGNKIIDRLYATDVGGRIIRVDIPDQALAIQTGDDSMDGTILADVNGDSTAGAEFQRFFAPPTAAYYKRGGLQYMALIVASGHRPQPLSRSVDTDRLYAIKDPFIWMPPVAPATYPATLTESDLLDATNTAATPNNIGWFIDLGEGEKGFSKAKVYAGTIMFTTYTGERGVASDSCSMVSTQGSAYMYALNLTTGEARIADFDGDDSNLTNSDRKKLLHIPGLPPGPGFVFPDMGDGTGHRSGDVIIQVGLEGIITDEFKDYYHPVSWEEIIDD